jgi:hypothetical protein
MGFYTVKDTGTGELENFVPPKRARGIDLTKGEFVDEEIKRRKAAKSNPTAGDDLGAENVVRKRYSTNWPKIILNLMKRIQGVNQSWTSVMAKLINRQDMKISYFRRDENLVVEVRIGGEVEQRNIPLSELAEQMTSVEVLVMNKLAESKLMWRQ